MLGASSSSESFAFLFAFVTGVGSSDRFLLSPALTAATGVLLQSSMRKIDSLEENLLITFGLLFY